MKKTHASIPILLFLMLFICGFTPSGNKNISLSTIYATAAILSFCLLIGCIKLIQHKRFWFILLFSSVFIVNVGYTILSVSSCLQMALWANRISYLGSVFLPLSMLMIILEVTNSKYNKCLPKVLLGVAILVFLIAASPGVLPIYYKEVSFTVINGVSTLVKVYGPLHPIYLIYLLSYFSAMVAIIIKAQVNKTIDTTANAVFIAIAVFVNIGVWFIEQITSIEFEMLSISYIISELFLLGVHLVMSENQRLKKIVTQAEFANDFSEHETKQTNDMLEKPLEFTEIDNERMELYINGLKSLTPTEKAVYDAYINRATSKEVMMNLNIKESTLKYHNRNLYGKLGVSTRKELLELHKYIKSINKELNKKDTN